MDQNRLEALLLEHSSEEIRHRFAAELTEENLGFLAKFDGFDQNTVNFSSDYISRFPQAPNWSPADIEDVVVPLPWYRRSVSLPIWVPGLAAAAILAIAFLLLIGTGKNGERTSDAWDEILQLTRSSQSEASLTSHDQALVDALLDRGYFFFGKGTKADFQKALYHFKLAYQLQPENARVLQYLILAAEALGLEKQEETWRTELDALGLR